jgi:hypothetical protein
VGDTLWSAYKRRMDDLIVAAVRNEGNGTSMLGSIMIRMQASM